MGTARQLCPNEQTFVPPVSMSAMCHEPTSPCLLDHLIGKREQPIRHVEAEPLGGLEIENKFEFGGLHDRQVGWVLAFENPPGIDANLPIGVGMLVP
jgi:hypothetical protein